MFRGIEAYTNYYVTNIWDKVEQSQTLPFTLCIIIIIVTL